MMQLIGLWQVRGNVSCQPCFVPLLWPMSPTIRMSDTVRCHLALDRLAKFEPNALFSASLHCVASFCAHVCMLIIPPWSACGAEGGDVVDGSSFL